MRQKSLLFDLLPSNRTSSPEVLEWFDAMFNQGPSRNDRQSDQPSNAVGEPHDTADTTAEMHWPEAPVVGQQALNLLDQMALEMRRISKPGLQLIGKDHVAYCKVYTREDETTFVLYRADGVRLMDVESSQEAIEMANENNLWLATVH